MADKERRNLWDVLPEEWTITEAVGVLGERDKARLEACESGANAARLRHERDKYLEALDALRSALRWALLDAKAERDDPGRVTSAEDQDAHEHACALVGLDPDSLAEVGS